jgi:excisionase family DNA binding protein
MSTSRSGSLAPAPAALATLLTDPSRALEVPVDAIAAVMIEVSAQEARLGMVKTVLAARLASTSALTPPLPITTERRPMTQEEVAERYRLPLRTIRRLTRTKRIPSTMVGRNRMIRASDLETYLARCQKQGVAVGTMLDV